MDYQLLHLVLLAAAGIAAGFINTIAGGGSVFTLPALMLMGLPADVANGTNRVGIFMQSAAGVRGFNQHNKLDKQAMLPIIAPTVIGGLIGSWTATEIPPETLKPILLATMIAITLLIVLKPNALPAEGELPVQLKNKPIMYLWLFGAGLYGGFIQAGVGFILLTVLAGAMRYDLVRANALKMLCTLAFGTVALAVFVIQDQVQWVPGLILGVSTMIGVHFSVKFAISSEQRVLKWIFLGMAFLVCLAALFK